MATVLITGTSKGIGLATALAFGRAGHKVIATMRNPKGSPELSITAAREKLPITISAIDVDSDLSVREGITRIRKESGPIDILINNAGLGRTGIVANLGLEDFRAVMETNYFGVIRCIHAVLPEMTERRSGFIINITSIAGRIASASMSPYSASKFALESLSEILAQEVKSFGVRVAIVEPGIIDTEMARHVTLTPEKSQYSHHERLSALFTASLRNPVPPSVVANKILEIAMSETWQLRHPVGPDALPFFAWRKSMSDEQWVDLSALDDEAWFKRIESDFGMEIPREPRMVVL